MSKKKKLSGYDRFMALTDAQKDAEVKKFDAPASTIKSRALNSREKAEWKRVQRRLQRGRPKIGKGVKRVMVSVESDLLSQADAFARKHHMKRSELIAQAIKTIMAKAG